ncbi:hypothetical protein [Nocardia puris]|uniref:hypothetical protein n=1 Tax=Nocardia puris TaxID=208602 RepID=UPI002E2497AE
MREELASIAMTVASRYLRDHGRLREYMPTSRLTTSAGRPRSQRPEWLYERQVERGLAYLLRAAQCEDHFAEERDGAGDDGALVVSARLRSAVVALLRADAAHAPAKRRDVELALRDSIADIGRVINTHTVFGARLDRTLTRLCRGGGEPLFTPTQVAAATYVIRGVALGMEADARISLGMEDPATEVGRLRHLAVLTYRGKRVSSPLVEVPDDRIAADLCVVRDQATWERCEPRYGRLDKAMAIYDRWQSAAHDLLLGSLDALSDNGYDRACASSASGPLVPLGTELRFLLDIRLERYLLPDGTVATPAQIVRIDARITELRQLLS